MSRFTVDQANMAISAAERVALNSEFGEQEISLFRSFFDSALDLLSDEQRIKLANSMAIDVEQEIAHEPYDMQAEHVDELRSLIVNRECPTCGPEKECWGTVR